MAETDPLTAPEEVPVRIPEDPTSQAIATLAGIAHVTLERGERVAHADRKLLPEVMQTLRDDPRFAFEQCMDVCGVDWPERPQRFDVVYNLLSVTRNDRLRVIVTTDEVEPVPSVSTIWPGVTWWEREVLDLFGVVFEGLADQRRILTDYDFEGYPMRKDFPLTGFVELRYDEAERRIVKDKVNLTQEFRYFDFLSPWEAVTTLPGDEKVNRNAGGETESGKGKQS